MATKFRGTPSVAGSVWFSGEVPYETLTGLLVELAQKANSRRLVDLHLRESGDDGSHVIAFHYLMRKGTKREQSSITKVVIGAVRQLQLHKRDTRYTMSTVLAAYK